MRQIIKDCSNAKVGLESSLVKVDGHCRGAEGTDKLILSVRGVSEIQ